MFLEPTPAFYEKKMDEEPKEERSFKFLFGYIKQYRKYYNSIKFNGMDINLENSIVNYIESICK
jgi:ABC transporter transmembrane region (fragment)